MVTYSIYAHHRRDGVRFEPFLCQNSHHALLRARDLLARDEEIHLVEVHFGDQHLFTVARPG